MIQSSRFLGIALLLVAIQVTLRADDWPQWRGPTRDGRWYEEGVVTSFDAPQLPLKWTLPISSGYTSPTVADGRVYLSDKPSGDTEGERILCVDAESGELLWTHSYESVYEKISYRAGPRAAITIHEGAAYALGTMGMMHCLDARSGEVRWARDLNEEYNIRMPVWGISAAPLIEGDLVYLQIGGQGNACVVALERKTGEERWRSLNDRASYSAPIMITQNGRRVLVCFTGGRIVGLDARTGEVYWFDEFAEPTRVIGVADPVYEDGLLFVSDFWEGALMLEILQFRPGARRLWYRKGVSERQTDGLHAMITTPILRDGYLYGVDSYGELRCLKTDTGERVWESLELLRKVRWGTMHLVRNQDKIWVFTEEGKLAITKMSPEGLSIISQTTLIEPTKEQHPRGVVWSHPAFANRHVFIRNDKVLVCASLAAPDGGTTP